MKKIIGILSGILMTFAFVTSVSAADFTVGNDTVSGTNTDSWSDFVVVDTNNPASSDGMLTNFSYYASRTNPFLFIVVDGGNTVKWVGEEIVPSTTGVNTYNLPSPVSIETGWNIGLYYPSNGTVPYNLVGEDALYTLQGHGVPVEGEVLDGAAVGNHSRTYSFNANGWYPLTTPEVTGFINPTMSCGAITNLHSTTVDWTDSVGGINGVAGYEYKIVYPQVGGGFGTWTTYRTDSYYGGSLNEGLHTVQVRAQDGYGYYSDWSNKCSITADWTAPLVTINSPSDSKVVDGIVDIYGTIVEDVAMGNYNIAIYNGDDDFMNFGLRLEQENGYPSTGFDNQLIYQWDTTGYDPGEYQIRFAARDKAGNRDLNGDPYLGGDDSQHVIKVYIAEGGVNGGGQIIQEMRDKPKDDYKISFGGQIWDLGDYGYIGDWEVNFHNVGKDDYDNSKFHGSEITQMTFYDGDSGTCNDAMNMTILGSFNNEPGYKIIFRAGDLGPHSAGTEEQTADTVRIELYKDGVLKYDTHWPGEFANESSCVGTARTGLDNGNITIWHE